MSYSIAELNEMSQEDFVGVLGVIFEETPVIAGKAWEKRPFADVDSLHQKMVDVVRAMSKEGQLALIRVHPDLGSKATMAEASVQEQSGVGLDRLTAPEYERFQILNSMYREKFGFPLIIAVRNQTKDSILTAFEHRLKNTVDQEIEQAIAEIFKIAQFRLSAIVV